MKSRIKELALYQITYLETLDIRLFKKLNERLLQEYDSNIFTQEDVENILIKIVMDFKESISLPIAECYIKNFMEIENIKAYQNNLKKLEECYNYYLEKATICNWCTDIIYKTEAYIVNKKYFCSIDCYKKSFDYIRIK